MPLIKQSILNAWGSFLRKIQKMDFESKELILLILTIYDPCVSLINRATDTIACVAWRFCRAGRTSGVVAKFAREARENERRSREKKLLPPQSPRGFSALARLYYLARPTKTAMLRRLRIRKCHKPRAIMSHCGSYINDWQKIVRCGKYEARHYLGSSCQYCSK